MYQPPYGYGPPGGHPPQPPYGQPGGYYPQPGGYPQPGQPPFQVEYGEKYYFVQSKLNGLVLDVEFGHGNEGSRIVMWQGKPEEQADNQLWSQDPYTGTVKSKLNPNMCMAPSGNGLTLQTVHPGRVDQQMTVAGDRVHLRNNMNLVMEVRDANSSPGTPVVMRPYNGHVCQQWEFIPASSNFETPSYQPPAYPSPYQPPSPGFMPPDQGPPGGAPPHMPGYPMAAPEPTPGGFPPPQPGYPGAQPAYPGYGQPPPGGYAPPPLGQPHYVPPSAPGYGGPPLPHYQPPPKIDTSESEPEPEPEECEPPEEVPEPEIDPRKFYIVSELGGRVLDVRGSNLKPKAEVNMYDRKPTDEPNQLFYQDDDGLIRSTLNRFTFDTSSGRLRLQPPNPNDAHRQWTISENKIINRSDPTQCLEVPKAKDQNNRRIEPAHYHGQQHQHWYFDYINE